MNRAVEAGSGVNDADLLNMTQQFVNRYARYHPSELLGSVLSMYRSLLVVGMSKAERKLERAKTMAALERNL